MISDDFPIEKFFHKFFKFIGNKQQEKIVFFSHGKKIITNIDNRSHPVKCSIIIMAENKTKKILNA